GGGRRRSDSPHRWPWGREQRAHPPMASRNATGPGEPEKHAPGQKPVRASARPRAHAAPRGVRAGGARPRPTPPPRAAGLSITAPSAAASVQVHAGGISVGHEQSLLLSGPAPRVLLQRLTRTLNGGQYVRVNMDFLNAGRVSLLVPVMPRAAFYASFSPAPL